MCLCQSTSLFWQSEAVSKCFLRKSGHFVDIQFQNLRIKSSKTKVAAKSLFTSSGFSRIKSPWKVADAGMAAAFTRSSLPLTVFRLACQPCRDSQPPGGLPFYSDGIVSAAILVNSLSLNDLQTQRSCSSELSGSVSLVLA